MSTALDHDAMSMGLAEQRRFAGPLERLMYLRGLPNLNPLQSHELMNVAQHTQERFFPAGTVILEQGAPVRAVYFIVEGKASMRRDGVTFMVLGAPATAGFLALHSNHPTGTEIRADEDTLALELGADAFFEIMEENFAFMRIGIRALAGQLADLQREMEARGMLNRSAPESVPYPSEQLDIVRRLSLFRRGPYAKVNLEPLAELARRAREVRLEPGEHLWKYGEPSLWGIHLVYGVINCRRPDGSEFVMGPNSVLGYLEANAERPRAYDAIAQTRIVALSGQSEVFFDVVEDHFELGVGFLSFMSDAVTSLHLRIAEDDFARTSAA